MAKLTPPKPGEYPPYYEQYIRKVQSDNIVRALRDDMKTTKLWFEKNKEAKWDQAYAEGKWTPLQVLNHIIDAERIFAYRILCIGRGETGHLPGFDQELFVNTASKEKRSANALIKEWKAVRQSTILLLAPMNAKNASRLGYANGQRVTAKAMAYILLGHQIHHLAVLVNRYNFQA
jgi:hypothetical protein